MSMRWLLTVPLAAVISVAGCDAPEAQFVASKALRSVVPQARKPVRAMLADKFGTPNHLVAWERFPVRYGGLPGKVAGSSDAANRFQVAWAGQIGSLTAPAELFWVSGSYEGKSLTVASYDTATRTVTLQQQLEQPPGVGDEFIVNPGEILKKGHQAFMKNCMHCHGVSGDGNGPTAKYLNPLPRDYRLGIFKFTTTLQTDKICRDDLRRTIKNGIPGTYMPSFMLLEDDKVDALVEYVRWLAMRGEYEHGMILEIQGPGYTTTAVRQRIADGAKQEDGETEADVNKEIAEFLTDEFPETVDGDGGVADRIAAAWTKAEQPSSRVVPNIPRTPDTPESRARGRSLFVSRKAKCTNCHGPQGLGNGPQSEEYETLPGSKKKYPDPGLHNDWGHVTPPRNLTRGIYRGGRRPYDIYCRVYAGIKGTKMPAFGGTVLKDSEIWDLVNYVLSIPYASSGSPEMPKTKDVASNNGRRQ